MDLFKLLGTISIQNADAIKALDDTSRKGQTTASKLGKVFSGIGKGALVAGKVIGTGMMAGATAVAGLVAKSTQSYAEYEQLVGGVETLFGESAAKVQEYAENAYKTAGLSANAYMSTVTSFSASLLQSLGGDTEKAAEYAHTAITDMSDNANKMGTDMTMIQNAYQGFAKQNYTMLDNLKLGYGGTKSEMERLLADAQAISGVEYDISSYADVVEAIHVIQKEMGITGTTAKEAEGTITGSMSSVKASWSNLLTALSSDGLPLDEYVQNFVNAFSGFVSNMIPRIEKALGGVVQLIDQIAPIIIEKIPELLSQLLPSVISTATNLVSVLVSMLPNLVDMLINNLLPQLLSGFVTIIESLVSALPTLIESIVSALPVLLPMLINGLVSMIVTLCSQFSQIIQPIIDYLPEIIISLVDAIMNNLPILIQGLITLVLGIVEAIPQIIQALVDALPFVMESIVVGLFNLLPVLIQGFIDLAKGVADAKDSIWSSVKEGFINYFKGIWNGIKQVFSKIGDWFGEKWGDVKDSLSGVDKWLGEKFGKGWENIKNAFSKAGNFFKDLWGSISKAFSDLGAKISDAISEPVKKGINGVIGGAENIINGFFGMINGAIDMINKIPNVNISKIKLVEFARLAKGGVVDKPTPAVFGEDGAEAVVPLENNTGWLNKIALQLHELGLQHGGGLGGISTRSVELQQMQVSELQTLNVTADKILAAILTMDENMGGNLRDALDGMSWRVNKREFTRLVKESV